MLFYNLDTPDLIENKYTHAVWAIKTAEEGVLACGAGALL